MTSFNFLVCISLQALVVLNFFLTNISTTNCFRHHSASQPQGISFGLGSTCKSSLQCLLFTPNSHCDWDNRKCECQPHHITNENRTMCLPGVLLTFECIIDGQCELKVPNSRCSNNRCVCKDNHIKIRFDKCLPPTTLDDYCLNDEMCSQQDPYSHCKWIVPRAYGKCKCSPEHYYSSTDKRCYPKLAQKCRKNSDCEKATKHSKCGSINDQKNTPIVVKASSRKNYKNKVANKSKHKNSFNHSKYIPSSALKYANSTQTKSTFRQSKLTKNFKESTGDVAICRCMAGYVESEGKSCLAVDKDVMPSPLHTSSNQISKRCNNSYECKLRDPYTHCVNGVCDCIKPNLKCNAQRTGCLDSTFQCKDGNCISWYFVCDKQTNCPDRSDETECVRYHCPKEAFQCADGHCISKAFFCDGKKDCSDGSDEIECKGGYSCPSDSFRCKNGQCLPAFTFCNNIDDCSDHSDEDPNVCESSKKCPYGTFQCRNNNCRSTAILCTNIDGCGDHSDEERCHACHCDKPN